MTQAIELLIARCEAATAEDQDEVVRDVVAHVTRRWPADRRAWMARALDAECYESVALALVPAGWEWGMFGPAFPTCSAMLSRHDISRPDHEAHLATPALAFCAALLRATMEPASHG